MWTSHDYCIAGAMKIFSMRPTFPPTMPATLSAPERITSNNHIDQVFEQNPYSIESLFERRETQYGLGTLLRVAAENGSLGPCEFRETLYYILLNKEMPLPTTTAEEAYKEIIAAHHYSKCRHPDD